MRPEEYIAILRRRWWLPVLGLLLAAAVAYTLASRQPVVYEATTRLMALAIPIPSKPEGFYWPDLYAKNRLESYRAIASSPRIAQRAVSSAGLDLSAGDLLARLATRHNPSDNTVTLAIRDSDPALAARAVNALADALVTCLNDPACEFTPGDAPQVRVIRLDEAGPPGQPTGVQPRLNAAGGGILGLALGLLLAVLVEYLDDALRTPVDIRRALGLATLGRLPGAAGQGGADRAKSGAARYRVEGGGMPIDHDRLPLVAAPSSPLAEAYRVLRTNLLYGHGDTPLRSLLVVGVGDERGSDVAANLALAIAQTGQRTVLIDANLRQPAQHQLFGLTNEKGLATALTTDAPPALLPTGLGLELLPAGPPPAAPTEALGSARFEAILRELTAQAAMVVIDAPPVSALADASVIAPRVDGVLLVIRGGKTRRARAVEAGETLERLGARVLGVTLVETKR